MSMVREKGVMKITVYYMKMEILVIAVLLFFNGYTVQALTCTVNQFKCGDETMCIHNSWKCDGTTDCSDGTDEQECGKNKCSASLFACKNGQCIPASWKCDGQDDCGDNSDETSETCPKENNCQFRCHNGKCLSSVWVCDKFDDCGDNSDEENCDPKIATTEAATTKTTASTTTTQFITTSTTPRQKSTSHLPITSGCSDNEFQCRSDKMCILKNWKCDGFRDCDDSSDETNCDASTTTSAATTKTPTTKLTTRTTTTTEEATTPTTQPLTTVKTFPLKGLSERAVCGKDQFLCGTGSCTFKTWRCDGDNDCGDNSDEKNCEGPDPITHTPKQQIVSSSCSSNQFRCVSSGNCIHNNWVCDHERDCKDGSDEFQCVTNPILILATKSAIKKISLNFDSSADFLKTHSGTVAVDIDIHTQYLYWSDIKRKEIRRASLNGRSAQTILSNVGIVEGIAIDWVARKLYWTDSLSSVIGVSGLLGQNRRNLIGSRLDQPRGIAVHPSGYIFWTEWGARPRLSRCSMDGKPATKRTIIDKDIVWPNAVTVDFTTNTLWWADAKLKKIEHCDLDGSNRHVIPDIGYPFSLAVGPRYVYWTNWESSTIDRIEKDINYQRIKKSSRFKELPLGITLLDGQKHSAVLSECTTNNGGCSHLCLLSRESSHYSCHCPDKMQLSRDSKSCTSRVENACSSKQFRCDRGLCIDKSRMCDGIYDCMDNTDEHYCLTQNPRLVFGNLKKYVALSGLTSNSPLKKIADAKSVTGIDIDVKNGYVFWADTALNAITKTALNKNGDVISHETLENKYVFTPEGLSFDWITNKLYWIDSYLQKIEVIDVDKKYRCTIVEGKLDRPRAIVVHPKLRQIFWTDWGKKPHIATIEMDGNLDTYRVLVNTGIYWPNGITIDYDRDILYWADAKLKKMEKMSINGGRRRTFTRKILSHPFSLLFYNDFIYWGDWRYQKIYKVNKHNKMDSIVRVNVGMPVEMAIFDKDRQKKYISNPCEVFNGGCSHLCLLNAKKSEYTCKCPRNLFISKDRKTCINMYTTTRRSLTNSLLDIGIL